MLEWTDGALEEFAGWFCGKTSPAQLFWHSFGLALARCSGAACAVSPGGDPVSREAYSHEVIAFGFWAGDEQLREPSFYSYTALEPAGLREQPLAPREARWTPRGDGSLAILPYAAVRTAADPRATLLSFLEAPIKLVETQRAGTSMGSSRPGIPTERAAGDRLVDLPTCLGYRRTRRESTYVVPRVDIGVES